LGLVDEYINNTKKRGSLHLDPAISCGIDCLLAEICLENTESTKVPFPEFGVDIVVRKGNFYLCIQGKNHFC